MGLDGGLASNGGQSASVATASSLVAPGAYLYNPKGLRRWAAALSDAVLGQANIVCYGDSITVGAGSDGNSSSGGSGPDATYRTSGWVAQLRTLFAATYGTAGEGLVGPGAADNGSRFTYVAPGGAYSGAGPMENGARITANATPGTITGALPACTEVDFWTWDGGGGTCSVTIDGASTGFSLDGGGSGANTFSAGNGSSTGTTFTKHKITGLSNATHTIVITGPTTSAGIYIAAMVCMVATAGVLVHRLGKSGNTTPNLLGFDSNAGGSNTTAQARILAATGLIPATDLAIIALGVNDYGNQNAIANTNAQPGTIPTGYASNLQAIVNQIVTAGGCVLLLGEPRQNIANAPSPATYSEQNYYDQAKAIAQATDHCAFFDINDTWGSNVLGQQLSLYTTGSVHPTRKGHGSIARLLHRALTVPYGFNAPTV